MMETVGISSRRICRHEHMDMHSLTYPFVYCLRSTSKQTRKHCAVVPELLMILQLQYSISQLNVSKESSVSQSHRQNHHLPREIHPCSTENGCQDLEERAQSWESGWLIHST